jgi:hypothetical protein
MAETIKIGNMEVVLDEKKMEFNETNLNEYIKKEHGIYAYFSQQQADAEYFLAFAEAEYEKSYNEMFSKTKENDGGSDKLVEAKCKADQNLSEKRKNILLLKRDVAKIKGHLKAWDRAHDNAQSFGHNLRKEMEKLGSDIRYRSDPDIEARLEEILKNSQKSSIDNNALEDVS